MTKYRDHFNMNTPTVKVHAFTDLNPSAEETEALDQLEEAAQKFAATVTLTAPKELCIK